MIVDIILLFISFIILSISSGFISNSSRLITSINGYNKNNELQTAHVNSVWAAVIGWISVVLILGLIIFYIFYITREGKEISKTIILIFFIVIMIIVLIVGIFSAITAYHINKANVSNKNNNGSNNGSNNNGSYHQSIISAVLAIVGFTLLLVSFIVFLYVKFKNTIVVEKFESKFYKDFIKGEKPFAEFVSHKKDDKGKEEADEYVPPGPQSQPEYPSSESRREEEEFERFKKELVETQARAEEEEFQRKKNWDEARARAEEEEQFQRKKNWDEARARGRARGYQ